MRLYGDAPTKKLTSIDISLIDRQKYN